MGYSGSNKHITAPLQWLMWKGNMALTGQHRSLISQCSSLPALMVRLFIGTVLYISFAINTIVQCSWWPSFISIGIYMHLIHQPSPAWWERQCVLKVPLSLIISGIYLTPTNTPCWSDTISGAMNNNPNQGLGLLGFHDIVTVIRLSKSFDMLLMCIVKMLSRLLWITFLCLLFKCE